MPGRSSATRTTIHDSTRRFLCRVIFLAVCAVPTLVTLSWGLWHSAADHARHLSEEFSSRFGLQISIDRAAFPRPGISVLRGVSVRLPNAKRAVATADELTIIEHHYRAKPWLELRIGKLEISAAAPRQCEFLIEELIRRNEAQSLTDCHVTKADVVTIIDSENEDVSLVEVTGGLQSAGNTSSVWMKFRPDRTGHDQICLIEYQRQATGAIDQRRVRIETSDVEFPCRLLAFVSSAMASSLKGAHFSGNAQLANEGTGWDVESMNATLRSIDLDQIITRNFPPYALRGLGTLRLKHVQTQNHRIVSAVGSFSVQNGEINHALIRSAERHLGLGVTLGTTLHLPPDARPTAFELFDCMSLRFQIQNGELQLHGDCGLPDSGELLQGRAISIACEQAHQMAATSLPEVLSSPDSPRFPVSPNTEGILRAFLPESASHR